MMLGNPEFHKNINKQQCLLTNLSRDFISFMTTINYILFFSLKQSLQAVWDYIKIIHILDFVTIRELKKQLG